MARSAESRDTAARFIWPTYWKKGAAIGGAEVQLYRHLLVSAVGGALLLAIPGALIGGQFHKPEAESQAQ
jgi:hypothetical protein